MCVRVRVCACVLTPQQLLDFAAGLRGGELVDDVQGRLAQRVPHPRTDATLRGQDTHLNTLYHTHTHTHAHTDTHTSGCL